VSAEWVFCAPGRNRTYDRQIRRLLLYPLSYGGRIVQALYAGSRITVAPESFWVAWPG
jgi:hypothetical protein